MANDTSDSDFLIITKSEDDHSIICRALSEFIQLEPGLENIDAKVLTEDAFQRHWVGQSHFFLWNCLSTGKILFGERPPNANLNRNQIRWLINKILDDLDASYLEISNGAGFIPNALVQFKISKTLYYLSEEFSDDLRFSNLQNQQKMLFNRLYQDISKIDEDYRRKGRANFSLGQNIKFDYRSDAKYTQRDFSELVNICANIEEYAGRIINEINSKIDVQ